MLNDEEKNFDIRNSLFNIQKTHCSNNTGMLKNLIRTGCQKLMGFDNYLFIFSLINIALIRISVYGKEFQYFLSMIPNEGAILDIGANIGIMTVLLAKKYTQTTVYAFEPIPQNIRALERVANHYQLTNVQIFSTALGNLNGEVKMLMPLVKYSKMQGLSHVLENLDKREPGEIFSVSMQRMDDMPVLQALSTISAIKVDVENFEYFVLQGAQVLLEKHRPIVYSELWNDDRRTLCIELMKHIGYKVKIFRKGGLVDFTGQPAVNFFFLP